VGRLTSDDDLLVAAHFGNLLLHVVQKLSGSLGRNVSIKERVAVGRNVVGGFADGGVTHYGNKGVDTDDGAGVSDIRAAETLTAGIDDAGKVARTLPSKVDNLIADRNGVNGVPVSVDVLDKGLQLFERPVHVPDTGHDLDSVGLRSGDNVLDLAAVHTVETDGAVILEQGNVGGHLFRGLAAVVGVVGRVDDSRLAATSGRVGSRHVWGAGSNRLGRGGRRHDRD